MKNAEIFLSYAWGGESEKIIDELDAAFRNKGITPVRDKRDLGFKGLVTGFMQRIGEGHAVVTVISDKYLKSPYCMFELLEIYRNRDFTQRIFPIVLDDAKIYDPLPRLQYHTYWENKRKELEDAIKEHGLDAIFVIWEEFKIYKRIFDSLGEVMNVLKNINALTSEMHRADNFITLIDEAEKIINPPKNLSPEYIEPIKWEFVVRTIKRQECILFLGPELFRTNDNSSSKQQAFFEKLAKENPEKILSYNHDGFILFGSPQERIKISRKLIDFFEGMQEEAIIRKIAEIPFHTIISINPDNSLKKIFAQNRHPYTFEYFDKNIKKDIPQAPTKEKPLIYNLFGSTIKLDSLVLTHDDLFDYFKAVLGNNGLPKELHTALESAKNYIFLGFQFDKWYVQLILSLLKLHDKKYKFIRYALENAMSNDTKSLCIKHFMIQFINKDNQTFIDTLHDECAKEGILRNFSKESRPAEDSANDFKSEIEREYQLLSGFEQMIETEEDPIKQMEYEDTIDEIKKKIEHYEKKPA